MRASRLLQILFLLQNRGRMTSRALADELEVTPRTILRDVDAMTEAGLPIIVFQGNQGGIELGFNYRTRLTGLARDEAEALGIILATGNPMVEAVGLGRAADVARSKLVESFPDGVRGAVQEGMRRFQMVPEVQPEDARIAALARAVRGRQIVRIRARSAAPQEVHPVGLRMQGPRWWIEDARSGARIAADDIGDINISARCFGADGFTF